MKKRIIAFVMISVFALALLTGCGKSDTDKNEQSSHMVCIALQPSAAFIPMMIARRTGDLEKALKKQGVRVVWYDFESGPPMNDSIANGETDICLYGDVPTVSAIEEGCTREVVGISAQAADSYAMVVSNNSPIKSAADLKGKKVATNLGSTGHNMVDKYLSTAGLTINDIELVSATPADMSYMVRNGIVDAISVWEPSITRLVDNGDCRILAQGSDCGLEGINTIVGRKEYCEANPEVVETILKEYKRAADNISDTSDETWEYVAKYLGLDVSQVKSMLPKYRFTVDITKKDIESLNDTINFLTRIGKLDKSYDISEYCNSNYYEGNY
ncbi:MAG: aliphatic sulfonate ABC transporter substrate-binding protein [Lachnospiraceae bacterium]|nr:aliphatic sulfonate ABC transporter substrate-binding protein [Lachnospiraceae bacterium]